MSTPTIVFVADAVAADAEGDAMMNGQKDKKIFLASSAERGETTMLPLPLPPDGFLLPLPFDYPICMQRTRPHFLLMQLRKLMMLGILLLLWLMLQQMRLFLLCVTSILDAVDEPSSDRQWTKGC